MLVLGFNLASLHEQPVLVNQATFPTALRRGLLQSVRYVMVPGSVFCLLCASRLLTKSAVLRGLQCQSMGQDVWLILIVREKEVLKCEEKMCVSKRVPNPRSKGGRAASPLLPFFLTLPSGAHSCGHWRRCEWSHQCD